MAHEHHSQSQHAQTGHTQGSSRFRWRMILALVAFLGIAAFFLFSEHRAHVLGFVPYLLLLACPLLHLFMHGRHGHGASHNDHGSLAGDADRRSDDTR